MDRAGPGVGATTVVGLVGACGGAGTTTLAAALAHTWGSAVPGGAPGGEAGGGPDGEPGGAAPVVLVDLDAAAPGLDVQLGIEDVDGLRWADLSGARGDVPGAELVALLPVWRGVPVLSGDRWRPGPAPPEVVADVLSALVACHRTVVLDLGRREVLDEGPALAHCTVVLVVTPCDLRSVAGVVALRRVLGQTVADVRLAVRGPGPGGLSGLEVAHVVDLPVAGRVPHDRHLGALVERGFGPVPRRRGGFGRAVRRLARDLS
ncbi:pilus assembly protein FlpE [uncultured Cellulomonas sp.]|uniref:pilus assembly protein FlpE n=1 Tax=uncultured Cellulomonas sp. TaxID=189682 RepID=UPI002606263F|nr:pilus assembly protein FlpE [uncultured Cellulomonas sp.]